jgi:Phage capsid family
VGADWPGTGGEDPYDEASPLEPTYSQRPAGMRPAGMRPAGMRPAGMRPAGMRPAGMRPAGMRPAGMRPAGMRPAGMRPYEGSSGYLDPDEWGSDIGDLFCEYSAVVRMGARLVFNLSDLPFPSSPMQDGSTYVPEPVTVEPDVAPGQALQAAAAAARSSSGGQNAMPGLPAETTTTILFRRRLRPKAHELTVQVGMRNPLVQSVVDHPDVAWALKQDIAYALAFRADQGFLQRGPSGDAPHGITQFEGAVAHPAGGTSAQTAREMVHKLRDGGAHFVHPGWILHPATLDDLSSELEERGATAAGRLLTCDGTDGGTLFGYPYVLSAAPDPTREGPRPMYFSSDWTAAWIGAGCPLVTVDVSPDAGLFARDVLIIRAVTHHDFSLRSPECFIHTGDVQAPAAASGAT